MKINIHTPQWSPVHIGICIYSPKKEVTLTIYNGRFGGRTFHKCQLIRDDNGYCAHYPGNYRDGALCTQIMDDWKKSGYSDEHDFSKY